MDTNETPTPSTETPVEDTTATLKSETPVVDEEASVALEVDETDTVEVSDRVEDFIPSLTPVESEPVVTTETLNDEVGSSEIELEADITTVTPCPNTEADPRGLTSPIKDLRQLADRDTMINLLRYNPADVAAKREAMERMDVPETDETIQWLSALREGAMHLQEGNAFADTLQNEETYWRNKVTSGAQQLGPGRPSVLDKSDDGLLTGQRAAIKLDTMIGMGSLVRMPLWHTGLWLTFRAPSELSWLELDRRIANEKIELGRETNSLVFSNSSVYMTSYLVNFALAHLHDATYNYGRPEELKDIILTTDIPSLLLGLLIATYPNGYNYTTGCLADPEKCQHVESEILNLSKLFWADDRHFTEFQRNLMVRRNSKFTKLELDRYQEEHKFNRNGVVDLGLGIKVEFQVPTIAQYEQAGFKWVDGIVNSVDEAFGTTLSSQDRMAHINQSGVITSLMQYAHWVKRIVLEDRAIEDQQTIHNTISRMSSRDDLFNGFFTAVGAYINASTVALVAIPKYICPSCQKTAQTPENHSHPHLVPLDIEPVFFTLIAHRIFKALRKSMPTFSTSKTQKAMSPSPTSA